MGVAAEAAKKYMTEEFFNPAAAYSPAVREERAVNGARSVPTSVPPLYTFTVTVPLAHVDAVIWCARLSGTVHWYTTRPLLLLTVRRSPMLPEAVPSA